jgi:hypothetical protein
MSSNSSLISKQTVFYEKIKNIKIRFISSIQEDNEPRDNIIELNCTSDFIKNRLYFIIELQNDNVTLEVTTFEIDWFKYNQDNKDDGILYSIAYQLYCYVKNIGAQEMSIFYNNKEYRITYSDLGYFAKIDQDNVNDFHETYYEEPNDCGNGNCDFKYDGLIKNPNYLMLKLKINNMICNTIKSYINNKIKDTRDCPILLEPLKRENVCITRCGHIMCRKAYQNIKYVPTFDDISGDEKGSHKPCPICRKSIDHPNYMYY